MKLPNLHIAAAINALIAAGFFNTNAGAKLYICTTPKPDDIADAATYAALTWVQITGVGSVGEMGTTTNMLTYDTWDTTVAQKAKGISNAGDPVIELARDPDDAGQTALRTAANTNYVYAFKIERNDQENGNVGSSPTKIYTRGLVSGPVRPMGRNEDFDLERFTVGLVQKEIVVPRVTA